MHVQQIFAASAFVQIVDILRDYENLAGELVFEARQGAVSGIGSDLGAQELSAASIVEMVNELGVALEAFGGCDILHTMVLPESIASSEGINA